MKRLSGLQIELQGINAMGQNKEKPGQVEYEWMIIIIALVGAIYAITKLDITEANWLSVLVGFAIAPVSVLCIYGLVTMRKKTGVEKPTGAFVNLKLRYKFMTGVLLLWLGISHCQIILETGFLKLLFGYAVFLAVTIFIYCLVCLTDRYKR